MSHDRKIRAFVRLARAVQPEALERYRRQTREAIAKGATRGPGAKWPQPGIELDEPVTPFARHWLHIALTLSPEEYEEARAAIVAVVEPRNARQPRGAPPPCPE
jgi:hypothetical protein